MKLSRGLATAAAVCALAVTATACGDDGDDPKNPGQLGKPFSSSQPKQEESKPPAEPEQQSNGVQDMTAQEIADKSFEAFDRATSMRLTGIADGYSVDLVLDTQGKCHGTLGNEGMEMELVRNGDSLWLKGDEAFWKDAVGEGADTMKALIGDRYILVPKDEDGFKDMAQLCDLDDFRSSITEDRPRDGLTKGQVTEVNGTPAIALTFTDEDGGGTMYVSTVGDPDLLKLDSKSTTEPNAIVFADYNKPVTVQSPPADKVFDIGALDPGSAGSQA